MLFSENGSLKVRNEVELENYVAGVVEMEAGSNHTLEYYKVQAIICRTYALSNLRRHETERYNLCDNVHCQVYKGNNRLNQQITEATLQTKNLVLVDKKLDNLSKNPEIGKSKNKKNKNIRFTLVHKRVYWYTNTNR